MNSSFFYNIPGHMICQKSASNTRTQASQGHRPSVCGIRQGRLRLASLTRSSGRGFLSSKPISFPNSRQQYDQRLSVAGEHLGTWDPVRPPRVVRPAVVVVDADVDARVRRAVGTGESDELRGGLPVPGPVDPDPKKKETKNVSLNDVFLERKSRVSVAYCAHPM